VQFLCNRDPSGANGGSHVAVYPTPSPAPVRDRACIHEMRALSAFQTDLSDRASTMRFASGSLPCERIVLSGSMPGYGNKHMRQDG